MSDIPVIDINEENWERHLDFALWSTGGSSDYRNDRDRPYNGQPWTDGGIRGKQEVSGMTFRDLRDCFVKGLLKCSVDQPELRDAVEDGTWRTADAWKVDLSQIDPLGVWQTMSCEIEKMMGIYPNLKDCPSSDEICEELFREER